MQASHSTAPINLLVIDDVAANRTALRAILSPLGCNVIEAESGPDALRLLLDLEFAVLLLDVVMPAMNGFKLAEIIRQRRRMATIPIVFVTPKPVDLELIFRGYRAGAVDYLVKPLDADVVRAKVGVFIELYRQRKIIEASLREKEVLLREIHHRVKNNLQIISSLLSLQGHLQSEDVRNLFVNTCERVHSIALVHENLYQQENLATMNTDAYLRALINGLTQTHGSRHVHVKVEDHGVRLSMDTAILCGLIVNELVTNALKHAFPGGRDGAVTVGISETASDFLLEVRDDGIGMPRTAEGKAMRTMGLKIVRSLSDQLAGKLVFETHRGTAVRVSFPKPITSTA